MAYHLHQSWMDSRKTVGEITRYSTFDPSKYLLTKPYDSVNRVREDPKQGWLGSTGGLGSLAALLGYHAVDAIFWSFACWLGIILGPLCQPLFIPFLGIRTKDMPFHRKNLSDASNAVDTTHIDR